MANSQKKSSEKATKQEVLPYEETNVIKPLKVFFIIVPYGQADSIVKLLQPTESSCSFITLAEGTGARYLPELLDLGDSKKQIIMTIVREDKTKEVCRILRERFNVSNSSKGIAFSIKCTSVAGVSIYKFLTNTRKVKKVRKNGKQ